jgi:NitT/TauT family transport system substrate-binding protein
VDITKAAMTLGLDTQIALGNLAAQPDYATFVRRDFITKAVAGN